MGHVESDEDAKKSIDCIDNVMKTQKKKDVKKPED
jgi:hypothetical protein